MKTGKRLLIAVIALTLLIGLVTVASARFSVINSTALTNTKTSVGASISVKYVCDMSIEIKVYDINDRVIYSDSSSKNGRAFSFDLPVNLKTGNTYYIEAEFEADGEEDYLGYSVSY